MKEDVEYRVVCNGINYRAQFLGRSCLLRRPKWRWLYRSHPDLGCFIAEFACCEDAENAIVQGKKSDEAKKFGYQPI